MKNIEIIKIFREHNFDILSNGKVSGISDALINSVRDIERKIRQDQKEKCCAAFETDDGSIPATSYQINKLIMEAD